ncbi:cystatin-B-like [Centropristis striata]|uniref:cystatin-B-like n=1 Tax=Centropristis striata TaxID=184440 RepID=UPI0027DEC887|nr:cystatin-B-like [Centropristis striata]
MANISCGGWSGTQDATKETQKICDQVKAQVQKTTGNNYRVYVAVKYRNQIVAGVNFSIKVHVGGEDYIDLSVFQELLCNGGKAELRGVEQHRTKDSPLEPFVN